MTDENARCYNEFLRILNTPLDGYKRTITLHLRDFPQSSNERKFYVNDVVKWLPALIENGTERQRIEQVLKVLVQEYDGISWDFQDASMSRKIVVQVQQLAEEFNPFPSGDGRTQKNRRLDSILSCFLISTVYNFGIFSDDYSGLIAPFDRESLDEKSANQSWWDSAFYEDRNLMIECMWKLTIRTHIYLLLREVLTSLPAVNLRQKDLLFDDHFIKLTEHFPYYTHADGGLKWFQYVRYQTAYVKGLDAKTLRRVKRNADKLLRQVSRNLMSFPDTFRDRSRVSKGILKSRIILEEFINSRGRIYSLAAVDHAAKTLADLDRAATLGSFDVEQHRAVVNSVRKEMKADLSRFYRKKRNPQDQNDRLTLIRLLFGSIATSPPSYLRARELLFALTWPLYADFLADAHRTRKETNTRFRS